MIRRLSANRSLTTRQRNWLDTIISEGAPEVQEPSPANKEIIKEISSALLVPDTEDMHEILEQFKNRLETGRDLSEKQLSWCKKLLERIGVIKQSGRYRPNNETTARIRLAVECSKCYSNQVWFNRPHQAKVIDHAKHWLNGSEKYIEEWQVEKLFFAVKGILSEMENPKFLEGQICYVKTRGAYNDSTVGIVLTKPYIGQNQVGDKILAYDVLIDGTAKTFNVKSLRKRR